MPLPASASWILKAVPLPVVQAVSNKAFADVLSHHPGLLERMGPHADRTFAFAPTDVPLVFLVRPSARKVVVSRREAGTSGDATISAPIVLLLALLEGKVDGDAAFFARGIEVEGDMEAVLAVRNAIDDSAIDLARELAATSGPLHRPLGMALQRVRGVLLLREGVKWS